MRLGESDPEPPKCNNQAPKSNLSTKVHHSYKNQKSAGTGNSVGVPVPSLVPSPFLGAWGEPRGAVRTCGCWGRPSSELRRGSERGFSPLSFTDLVRPFSYFSQSPVFLNKQNQTINHDFLEHEAAHESSPQTTFDSKG